MTTRTTTWAALAGLTTLLAVSATVAGGLGGLLAQGETTHIRVVETNRFGVVAGLVTVEEPRPLGPLFGTETTVPDGGWVVLHAKGDRLLGDGPLTVTEEMPFSDPNGGTWPVREVTSQGGTGWVVPVGSLLYDETLDGRYNFAAVVDWEKVPEDADLVASFHEEIDLATDNAPRSTTVTH